MSNATAQNSSSKAACDQSAKTLLRGISLSPVREVLEATDESLSTKWLVYLLVTSVWAINRMAKNVSPRSDMHKTLYCAKDALLSVIVAACKDNVSVSYQEVHHENNLLITVREPMKGTMRSFHTALRFLSSSAKAVVWNLRD